MSGYPFLSLGHDPRTHAMPLVFYKPPEGNILKRAYEAARLKYHVWKARRAVRSGRPFDPRGFTGSYHTRGKGALQIRRTPYSYWDLYNLYNSCSTWRSCVQALVTHSLRPGFEWEQKYVARCPACEAEYDRMDDDGRCDQCDEPLEVPDPSEYRRADEFMEKVNSNGQSLRHLLQHVNEDVEVVDELYVIKLKTYIYDSEGDVLRSEIVEAVRADPMSMTPVQRPDGTMGGMMWVCLEHRDPYAPGGVVVEFEPGKRCRICDRKLHEVHFVNAVSTPGGSATTGATFNYYIEGEVIWKKKYRTGIFFGNPPGITLYHIASTLAEMELFTHDYYSLREMPNGIWIVRADNWQGVINEFERAKEQKRMNSHVEPIIPMFGEKAEIKYQSSLPTLKEAEWVSMRDEYRQRIMGFYEVMPIMQADTSQGGGLNNEGLQITVGNRSTEKNQALLQEITDDIVADLGVEAWSYMLQPVEERDRKAVIERAMLNLRNMDMALRLNLDIEIQDYEEFTFIAKGTPALSEAAPAPFGSPFAPGGTGGAQQRFGGEPESIRREYTPPPGEAHVVNGNGNVRHIIRYGDTFDHTVSTAGGTAHGHLSLPAASQPTGAPRHAGPDDGPSGLTKAIGMFGPQPLFSDTIMAELAGMPDLLWGRYDGVSREDSEAIGKMLLEQVSRGKMDPRDIVARIQEIDPAIDDAQAEAIARTELTNIVNKGRELQWKEDDPDGDRYLYRMVGPEDHRTCWAHKEMSRRQGRGLPLPQLKALAQEIFMEARDRGDFRGLELRNDLGFHPHQRWVMIRGERVE